MIKNYWKRFSNYEKSLAAFFIISIILDVVNNRLLNSFIPTEIVGYLFWLSLGLYLGFKLCKYEFTRVWNTIKADEQKEDLEKIQPFNKN